MLSQISQLAVVQEAMFALHCQLLTTEDRVSVVRALCRALEEELGSSSAVTVTGNESRHSRLHHGLKAARLTTERALPLQRLVCSVLRRANKKEAERALTLPIFPTTGGRFAVPLVPSSASVISPDEGWDQLLHPFFDDFLVSWEGAAGDVLRELEAPKHIKALSTQLIGYSAHLSTLNHPRT